MPPGSQELLAVSLQIVGREAGEHEAQALSFALDQRIRALGCRVAYVVSAEQQTKQVFVAVEGAARLLETVEQALRQIVGRGH
jgi:hypothetical protein